MTDTYTKNVATSKEDALKIVPRAEFRVFGKDIIKGVIEHMWACKAQLFKARVMPEETYILSRNTNEANVKVRDGCWTSRRRPEKRPKALRSSNRGANFNFRFLVRSSLKFWGTLKLPSTSRNLSTPLMLSAVW